MQINLYKNIFRNNIMDPKEETNILLENVKEADNVVENIVEKVIEKKELVIKVEDEEVNIGAPLLMELLEFEMNDNKIEHSITIIALEYMLKSTMLFKDAKERNKFFRDLDESFSKIVQDNNIDVKDIPELLKVTKTIYNKFNQNITNSDKINNYELTNAFLLTSMRIYLDMINKNNQYNNVLPLFKKIVHSAIELLSEQEVVHKKSWFNMFLLCK
jgi:hypothetical protein